MNNIEYFDEFLNESKFSDFKKRVYLNSTYIGFSGLAKLLLLLFPTSSHVLDINDYFSNGVKNYKETFDFFYKHNNNIKKVIDTKDENKIKEYLETIFTKYKEKYNRSLLDDLKQYYSINMLKFKNSGNYKDFWMKILDGTSEKMKDIDPYGEEDWDEDDYQEINGIKLYTDNEVEFSNPYFFKVNNSGRSDDLNKLFLNKEILFKPSPGPKYFNEHNFPILRKIITVKDCYYFNNRYIKFIDSNNNEYFYRAEEGNKIKILN